MPLALSELLRLASEIFLSIEVQPWRNEGTSANVSFCARRSARCLTFSLLIS